MHVVKYSCNFQEQNEPDVKTESYLLSSMSGALVSEVRKVFSISVRNPNVPLGAVKTWQLLLNCLHCLSVGGREDLPMLDSFY